MKIYERCLYDQMYEYFERILAKWQAGFRKSFGTQYSLLVMIETWQNFCTKGL